MTNKIRCLCFREPWLYLMLDLPEPHRKNVENRVRCITRQMGPMLAKSSVRKPGRQDQNYFCDVRERVLGAGLIPEGLFPSFEQLEFGGLRGCLNFTQLLSPGTKHGHRWKFEHCFGYVVDRAVRLSFRPFKGGGQGIFYTDVTNEEAEALSSAGLLPGYAPTERERALT